MHLFTSKLGNRFHASKAVNFNIRRLPNKSWETSTSTLLASTVRLFTPKQENGSRASNAVSDPDLILHVRSWSASAFARTPRGTCYYELRYKVNIRDHPIWIALNIGPPILLGLLSVLQNDLAAYKDVGQ